MQRPRIWICFFLFLAIALGAFFICKPRPLENEIGKSVTERAEALEKRTLPIRKGKGPWFITFLGDRRGRVGPCGCGRQPAGGLSALTARLSELNQMGPTLFLDLGNYSGSEGPIEKTNEKILLEAYKEVRKRSGVLMGINRGPLDREERPEENQGNSSEDLIPKVVEGIRVRRVKLADMNFIVVGLSTGDLEGEGSLVLKELPRFLDAGKEDVRIVVVAGGLGPRAETVARKIFSETSADFVFWTENGLGYVEGEKGCCLAAVGDLGSLMEIRIEDGRVSVDRTVLETARFSDPVLDRLVERIQRGDTKILGAAR